MGASTAWRSMDRLDCTGVSEDAPGASMVTIDQGAIEPGTRSGSADTGWLTIGVFPVIMAVPFGVVAWLLS